MTSPRFRPVSVLVSLVLAATVGLHGCSGSSNSSLGAVFAASTTATSPGVVKLVKKSISGKRMIVDAVIYGPDASLDLFAFQFDVKIGDTALVKFVPGFTPTQTALVAGTGQTISINVEPSMADPSRIECSITKQGGGLGNGIPGASAVVVELAFDVVMSGTTSLALMGEGANPPRALDSTNTPIAGVSFDALSASVKGVTSGGGGY